MGEEDTISMIVNGFCYEWVQEGGGRGMNDAASTTRYAEAFARREAAVLGHLPGGGDLGGILR